MSTQPITLVTAAAGKTGRHTALALLSRGLPVRAMVHREDARSAALRRRGAQRSSSGMSATCAMCATRWTACNVPTGRPP